MRLTATEMIQFVGREMQLSVDGTLQVPVRVLNARESWGKVQLLVEPIGGEGRRWVEAHRLK